MSTQNKQKCNYSRHPCTRFQYRDYKYCFQHILEDKTAPFMACQYISKVTKRRCHNPALKTELMKDSSSILCDIHKVSKFSSSKRNHRKSVLKKDSRRFSGHSRKGSLSRFKKDQDDIGESSKDTYLDSNIIDSNLNDAWLVAMTPSWKGGETEIDDDVSDDDENYLKHAGTYSFEEVVTCSKNCLTKLQSLYIAQFKQLQRKLLEKRRQYYSSQESSEEDKPSQIVLNPDDNKAPELRALLHYRRHSQENALLHHQAKRRRSEISKDLSTSQTDAHPNKSRCAHIHNHVRCKKNCLPYTKYCKLHILEDPLQVLYKKCSHQSCSFPVCLLPFAAKGKIESDDDKCFCVLHESLSPLNPELDVLMKRIKEQDIDLMKVDEPSTSALHDEDTNLLDGFQQNKKYEAVAADDVTKKTTDERDANKTTNEDSSDHLSSSLIKDDVTNISEANKGLYGHNDEPVKSPIVPMVTDDAISNPSIANTDLASDVIKNDDADHQGDVVKDGGADEVAKDEDYMNDDDDETKSDVKTVGEHVTSSNEFDHLGSGHCYIMSRVSMCDENDPSGVPALHLEPLTTAGSTTSSIIIPETTGYAKTIQPTATHSESSVLQLPDDASDHSDKKSIGVHHRGAVMSITNDRQTSESNHKTVVASSTLIPPVAKEAMKDELPGNENQDFRVDSNTISIKEMPPLAPLSVSSSNDVPQTSKEVADDQFTSLDVTKEIKPGVDEISDDVGAASEMLRNVPIEEGHQIASDERDQSPIEDECGSTSKRKPSSTDEETAVASLLSLSSGTLPSD